MVETTASFSQVESPLPGSTLPRGRHTIHGWVWPKPGGHFVDVRARIGPRIFPGVHGLPRADLAAHFHTGRPVALAEFYVVIDLDPGAVEVVLDVLEIEGRWVPCQTVEFQVIPGAPLVNGSGSAVPLRWIDYGFGLRQLLRLAERQPEESLAALAANLAGELPRPRVLRDVPAPLCGFVDEPASVCCCRFGRMPAFGHLFHPTLATRRILASVDLQSWQPLALHQPSPGPAAHYADIVNAQACGFVGLVDVPAQLPNPVSLRIYAELEDGSLHLGPVVRTRLHSAEDEKATGRIRPPHTFDLIQGAWDRALAARDLAVTRDAEYEHYVAKLRTESEPATATVAVRPAPPLVESPKQVNGALPKEVLLATHGLSRQGAPRFLLEYARALAAAGVHVQVVSAGDGPLRADFAALGAEITIVEAEPLLRADSSARAGVALAVLGTAAAWSRADLVVANSFTTFWAVHAAKAAGRPVLMYVHESTTPAAFYGSRVASAVVALAEQAFELADTVSFTTASTRNYHLGYGRPERHRLTPGWVDVDALDCWLGRQDRVALRRDFGLQPGELLVCNIGTVSDRKGQHTFARAVGLFQQRYPELAARTKFVLLGGRDSPFDTMLGEALAELALPNLAVHPETSDYLRYYLAADVLACSSYEESSPLVVLEAMACRTPILASDVQGIPELVRPDLEARLLPAGDTAAWCAALARMLTTPAACADLAARARARVEAHYAASVVLPRHLALAVEVAGGKD